MTTQDLLAAVKSIQPLIEAHAAEAGANRQLSSVGYDAMCRANLFAMSAPRARWGARTPPSGEHAGLGGDRSSRPDALVDAEGRCPRQTGNSRAMTPNRAARRWA